MSREVRRVPADWEHPRGGNGRYIPLYGDSYQATAKRWKQEYAEWTRDDMEFWEWDGPPPDPEDYMPDWEASMRTHYQMYETTSEGTPISPVFADPDELAHWLADTGASAFGPMTATYEQWKATIGVGWAPSLLLTELGAVSGVAAIAEERP